MASYVQRLLHRAQRRCSLARFSMINPLFCVLQVALIDGILYKYEIGKMVLSTRAPF